MSSKHGSRPPPSFTELNQLSSDINGAKILFATDDWFAAAENLLKQGDAEWKEDLFDDCGKWMDGWETRRKRLPGHDWAIIKLGYPGTIHGVDIDTSFFTGNYVLKAKVQAARLTPAEEALIPPRKKVAKNGVAATPEELAQIAKLGSENWTTIVPKTKLGSGYPETAHNYIAVDNREVWTHLRLNYYPDGGVARFRVYGQVSRDLPSILAGAPKTGGLVNLVAMENGGMCLAVTNAHYGHPRNCILPVEPKSMKDGWETARRQDRPEIIIADPATGVLQIPGSESAVFRLGVIGKIVKVDIDTAFFKGNFPDNCSIEWMHLKSLKEEAKMDWFVKYAGWKPLLKPTKLGAHRTVTFEAADLADPNVVNATHIKLTIAPDGGLARIRLWGEATAVNV